MDGRGRTGTDEDGRDGQSNGRTDGQMLARVPAHARACPPAEGHITFKPGEVKVPIKIEFDKNVRAFVRARMRACVHCVHACMRAHKHVHVSEMFANVQAYILLCCVGYVGP